MYGLLSGYEIDPCIEALLAPLAGEGRGGVESFELAALKQWPSPLLVVIPTQRPLAENRGAVWGMSRGDAAAPRQGVTDSRCRKSGTRASSFTAGACHAGVDALDVWVGSAG